MTTLISDTMNQRLNEQITNELHAEHSYLAMSCTLDEMGLRVLSRWFRQHAAEERTHAFKILDYIHEVGGCVTLGAIACPESKFDSAKAIAESAMQHELAVTAQINDLMGLAVSEKDYASQSFLQWFVDEQVEEVSVVRDLLELLDLAGDKGILYVESRVAKMLGK